jgi:UDP-N-acetylmuramate dehydrogenase
VARRAEIRAALAALPGVTVREEEPVARHGALRIGGGVEVYVVVRDGAALEAVVAALRGVRATPRLVRPLSDAFARDAGLAGVLLRLGPAFAAVTVGPAGLEVGVDAPLAAIGVAAGAQDPWAVLRTWPGTLGAWCEDLVPDIWARLFARIEVLTGRGVRTLEGEAVAGAARSALLLGGRLWPAPLGPLPPPPPWPGALFPADPDLWAALARSTLPGVRLRRVRLATEQVGLVANLGGGTARDLDLLARLIQERLARDAGLEVQARLQPLGRPPAGGNAPQEDDP